MEVLTEENEQTENRRNFQCVSIPPNQPFERELPFVVGHTNNPILQEQAIRLFELCDWNSKGFIVRSDLDRLNGLLPKSELELVFDKQDKERVGVVNRANFLEGIKSLLVTEMNNYDLNREKRIGHVLPTYKTTLNDNEDMRETKIPIRNKSSNFINEMLNSGNHNNNDFNTISLAEDEKDLHKLKENTRKQEIQTRRDVHPKTRKLTIAIEPSGDYESNFRMGLAKFHSIDDYGDGIMSCPSPTYSPHPDKLSMNRHSLFKKSSREEKVQKSKSNGRPPFSAMAHPTVESPTNEKAANFVEDEHLKADINPIVAPPPPPYRSISHCQLPHELSQLTGRAEVDRLSLSEENDPFYVNRQLSQPVHYENGQRTQFFYDYDDDTAVERRNRFQFAKVIERDSISHTDLSQITPPRYGDCDFRRSACEHSLADEMRDAARKYRGTMDLDLRTPDRVFKVVFVGDSAVGKTCFLHRFCHNRFKPLFNATIGVDFTVKTIRLQDRLVAVQLWDTAGQERFRSITKQYFRKADGVVLMYDVTSEQSFLNVRNWIESVRVGVDDGCVMCLVGNKVDLYPNDQCRTVTYQHGKELADEFDMIFFETSAYTGMGINECMRALASRLQQREMEHLEEALKLELMMNNSKSSSWCCV